MKLLILSLAIFIVETIHSQPKETLTNKDIIELTKAGLSSEIIISKIDKTYCNFNLSTNGIIELKKANVNEMAIKAMIAKMNSSAEMAPTMTSGTSKSTDVKKVNEASIEIINHPYAWVKNKNTLLLEKGTASLSAKMKLMGFSGTSTYYDLGGETSPVRISINDSLSFIINTGGGSIPELTLYKTTNSKGKRSAKVSTVQGLVPKKGEKNSDAIIFAATQLKNGIYEIKPSIKLDKGEYLFCSKITISAASVEVFAFAIE